MYLPTRMSPPNDRTPCAGIAADKAGHEAVRSVIALLRFASGLLLCDAGQGANPKR